MKTRLRHILAIVCLAHAPCFGQSSKVESIILLDPQPSTSRLAAASEEGAELIRERYADGKVRVERQVAMNEQGDFVNHGHYRAYSPKGEIMLEGDYTWGERSGSWMKRLDAAEFKQLQPVAAGFKAPLTSATEFVAGKMNTMWVIADSANRIIAQIELRNGLRHGQSVFFYPSGEVRQQATFANGVLDGAYFERLDGKSSKDQNFANGRKVISDVQKLQNGSTKSSFQYLSAVHKIAVLDDWTASTLGKIVTDGEQTLHGSFVTYHDNGSTATKGSYLNGVLDGSYEAWHSNGEVAIMGNYRQGAQTGEWTWRHANGMKQAMATYSEGLPQGTILAWDDSGKAVPQSEGTKAGLTSVRATDKKPAPVR